MDHSSWEGDTNHTFHCTATRPRLQWVAWASRIQLTLQGISAAAQGPVTPASTRPGGWSHLLKKMQAHISGSKSSLALTKPWEIFSEWIEDNFLMPVFQDTACWILRLSNAQLARVHAAATASLAEGLNCQLCLCAHELTAQLLSHHLHLLWPQVFVIFSLPAFMGPLYIRQYCLNYVYLSPVIQKTHCCYSFILPVSFNSSLQTINLKITVSSLIAPCCWSLLKTFETDPPPPIFLFLYDIFLIPRRNSFMLMNKIFPYVSYPTLYFL